MADTPTTEPDPYADPDWWKHVPSVDGIPAATERDPELEPDEAGRAYLDELQARLEARAAEPDVQAFLRGDRQP